MKEVKLINAIVRENGNSIDKINIRKPKTGDLRGVKLTDLFQMDVSTLTILIPRLCTPTITAADINNMDLADILEIGTTVVSFFERVPMGTEMKNPENTPAS